MREENIISFMQFCESMKKEFLDYLPEKYRDGNYQVVIEEQKDSFDQIATWMYVENKKKPLENVPKISMDGAYENLKRVNAKEKVFLMAASTYDKMYGQAVQAEYTKYDDRVCFDIHQLFVRYVPAEEAQKDKMSGIYVMKAEDGMMEFHLMLSNMEEHCTSCKLTEEQLRESNVDDKELLQEAIKNVPTLLPLTVKTVPGNANYNVTAAYFIKKLNGTTWEMYGNDVFEKLSTEAMRDLIIIDVSGNSKLALCADSIQTLNEAEEVMAEMRASGYGFHGETISLYESQEKRFVTDKEEIEAIVSRKERRTKSIFNR